MHDCEKGMGCIMSSYGAIMANSCVVLTSPWPGALGLNPLLASKDFGHDKDVLHGFGSPKCDYYILIG